MTTTIAAAPRIAVGGFMLESNSHAPVSTRAEFEANVLLAGDDLAADLDAAAPRSPRTILGFARGMDGSGPWTRLPTLLAAVGASGPCDQAFFDWVLAETLARLRAALASVTLETRAVAMPYFKGKGCEACAGSGLKGRQGAYEVMFLTPELRRLILQSVGAAEIKEAAIAGGMLTLRMDGLLKVWKGIVPLEQVVRETSA